MKIKGVYCKFCINECKKFGKIECSNFDAGSIEALRKERKELLITKSNPERLEIISKRIDFFDYGVK